MRSINNMFGSGNASQSHSGEFGFCFKNDPFLAFLDRSPKLTDLLNLSDLSMQAVKEGNKNGSIDAMAQLALRNDTLGNAAEQILFDIFSGKTPGCSAKVKEEIQNVCLELLKLKNNAKGNAWDADDSKLKKPSKLLYMAGASALVGNLGKQDITKMLESSSFEKNEELWAKNRTITNDELGAMATRLNGTINSTVNFNAPYAIQGNDCDDLGAMIADNLYEKLAHGQDGKSCEAYPVQIGGGHWVLYGHYMQGNDRKAFVFDSYPSAENAPAIDSLKNISETIGCKNFAYIRSNLQHHVPNGCGLFVAEAMRRLANSPLKDPETTLTEFTKKFEKKYPCEQLQFNEESRRQIYGELIDYKENIRQQTALRKTAERKPLNKA